MFRQPSHPPVYHGDHDNDDSDDGDDDNNDDDNGDGGYDDDNNHIGPVAHFVDVGVTRNVKGCQKLQSGQPTHFVDQHIC